MGLVLGINLDDRPSVMVDNLAYILFQHSCHDTLFQFIDDIYESSYDSLNIIGY